MAKDKTPKVAQWLDTGRKPRFLDTEGAIWRLRSRKGPDGQRIWLREGAAPTFEPTDIFTADPDLHAKVKTAAEVLGEDKDDEMLDDGEE